MGTARRQTFLKMRTGLSLAYGVITFLLSSDAHGIVRAEIFVLALPVALIVTLCLFAIGWLFAPRCASKAFREHGALVDEFTYRWMPEGIEIMHDRCTNRLPWPIFHGWLNGPTTLMLYQSSILFNAIPKRVLASGDLDTIVDHLRNAGVRERKRFGLLASKTGGFKQGG